MRPMRINVRRTGIPPEATSEGADNPEKLNACCGSLKFVFAFNVEYADPTKALGLGNDGVDEAIKC